MKFKVGDYVTDGDSKGFVVDCCERFMFLKRDNGAYLYVNRECIKHYKPADVYEREFTEIEAFEYAMYHEGDCEFKSLEAEGRFRVKKEKGEIFLEYNNNDPIKLNTKSSAIYKLVKPIQEVTFDEMENWELAGKIIEYHIKESTYKTRFCKINNFLMYYDMHHNTWVPSYKNGTDKLKEMLFVKVVG